MLIREAILSDAAGIAEVVHSVTEIRSVAAGTIEDTRSRIAQALSVAIPSGTSTVLVGVTPAGTVLGYCAVHWVPFLFLPGPEAYVTELFVRPTNRNVGLGSTLLREVETRARQRGCSRLSLLNGRHGESYRRGFYAKRSWVERDRMANFILPLKELPKQSPPPAGEPERGQP